MSFPDLDLIYEPNYLNEKEQNELLEFLENLEFNN